MLKIKLNATKRALKIFWLFVQLKLEGKSPMPVRNASNQPHHHLLWLHSGLLTGWCWRAAKVGWPGGRQHSAVNWPAVPVAAWLVAADPQPHQPPRRQQQLQLKLQQPQAHSAAFGRRWMPARWKHAELLRSKCSPVPLVTECQSN